MRRGRRCSRTAPRRLPRTGARGFSLVEAVVAVAILALVLALAFGGVTLIRDRRLAGAVREVIGEVRWVAQRAQAERRCWRIQFDPAGDLYRIQYLAGGAWTPGGGCSGGTWTGYTAPAGRSLATGIDLAATTFAGDTLTVSPFGGMNPGVVTLRHPGGRELRVDVNAGGRVVEAP